MNISAQLAESLNAMNEREAQIIAFLSDLGMREATRIKLKGDASFRRYERLLQGSVSRILMDAPPARENVRPFMLVDDCLRDMGYSAPEIYAADAENGFLLLEDLGDDLFSNVLAGSPSHAREMELYSCAIEMLADLHSKEEKFPLPEYSMEKYFTESNLFAEWYVPRVAEGSDVEALKEDMENVIGDHIDRINDDKAVMVLRDFHAENLIWLPSRHGVKRIGLLDFQDALIGRPEYDIVSLLEDARRDVPESVADLVIKHYLHLTGGSEERFKYAYAVLGAQRNLKILGIFVRLAFRDGKKHYLSFLPRVWNNLLKDLHHHKLDDLAELIMPFAPDKLPIPGNSQQ